MAYGSDHPISSPKPMIKTHGMNGNHKWMYKSNSAASAASTPAPTNQPNTAS